MSTYFYIFLKSKHKKNVYAMDATNSKEIPACEKTLRDPARIGGSC
jgi:hypothetical protein